MRKPLGSCLALPASLDSREIFPGMMLKASIESRGSGEGICLADRCTISMRVAPLSTDRQMMSSQPHPVIKSEI